MLPSAEPSDDARGNFKTVSHFLSNNPPILLRILNLRYRIAFSITLVFSRAQLIPFPCFQPAPEDPRAGRDQPPHAHEDGAPPRPRANHYA